MLKVTQDGQSGMQTQASDAKDLRLHLPAESRVSAIFNDKCTLPLGVLKKRCCLH